MTIELLSKQELQLLNKKGLKYPLAVAEKDYFLAVVLKILSHSGLKDALVFKGGTALHHTYLPAAVALFSRFGFFSFAKSYSRRA
jgi:predicted nucleotidyltransferase component of viral defense system